jgi:hypothetical protein
MPQVAPRAKNKTPLVMIFFISVLLFSNGAGVFPLSGTKQGAGVLFRSKFIEKQTDGEFRYEELCGRSEASAWIKNRLELPLAAQRAMRVVGEDPE